MQNFVYFNTNISVCFLFHIYWITEKDQKMARINITSFQTQRKDARIIQSTLVHPFTRSTTVNLLSYSRGSMYVCVCVPVYIFFPNRLCCMHHAAMALNICVFCKNEDIPLQPTVPLWTSVNLTLYLYNQSVYHPYSSFVSWSSNVLYIWNSL